MIASWQPSISGLPCSTSPAPGNRLGWRATSSWGHAPPGRAGTFSAHAIVAMKPSSVSHRARCPIPVHSELHARAPFLQSNQYKERSYPVWTLLPELNRKGLLNPAQAILCAASMPPEELYDTRSDPFEIHNLAASPAHAKVLRRLRTELEAWIDRTQDQGRQLEPPSLPRRKALPNPARTPTPATPRRTPSPPRNSRRRFRSRQG